MKNQTVPDVKISRWFGIFVICGILFTLGYLACTKPDGIPSPPERTTESPPEVPPEDPPPPVALTEVPPISELEPMSCFGNADVTGNGNVDLDDILVVLSAFSSDPCPWSTDCMVDPNCPQDVCFCRRDGTHVVDLDDILAVLTAFSNFPEGGRQDGICPFRGDRAIMIEKEVAEDEWVLAVKNEQGHWVVDEGQQTRWSVVELP